ncbi:MAG: MCE family protein [Rhodospirillales bacterium]|nr:MCE family protein [Rhodospirillales bacterium]
MRRNLAETVMGGVVLLVAAWFLYVFTTTAQVKTKAGYELTAKFTDTGGLQPGSDVRISGIAVGSVTANRLDPKTYEAIVSLSIRPGVNVPKDTVATIASAGLIGGNYIRLKPGRSKEILAAGAPITKSEDFRSLERQVGEIIFLATGGNGKKDK